MATVKMMRVYQVDWSFSDMTTEELRAAGRDGFGDGWVYDDYALAVARAKHCLDTVPKSEVTVTTGVMTPEEFAAVPPDDDPEVL